MFGAPILWLYVYRQLWPPLSELQGSGYSLLGRNIGVTFAAVLRIQLPSFIPQKWWIPTTFVRLEKKTDT